MRTLTAGMQLALDSGETMLAVCWKIIRERDKKNITGFTSATNAQITVDYEHGLTAGDSVYLTDVGGFAAVCARFAVRFNRSGGSV